MDFLDNLVLSVNDVLYAYVLIILLVGLGIWFTFRTGFVQLRCIKEMVRLLCTNVGASTEKNHISPFQAFCISTASRVGVGNIAGIAIAIIVGGPGAIFWMWVMALIGSATGFVESTLAQIYKVPRAEGGFRGGPAYYIKNALHNNFMAILFVVLICSTYGLIFNSVQANTITLSLQGAFGFDRTTVGIIVSIMTAMVIFGGINRIAKVSEWMVPVMAGIYLLIAFYIVIKNINLMPQVIYDIVTSAFSLNAAFGGGMGLAMMTGIKRGLFSNEAGMGSVPNAAATATTDHPVTQGLIQALGVFVRNAPGSGIDGDVHRHVAVVAGDAVGGSDPHAAERILRNGEDRVAQQTLFRIDYIDDHRCASGEGEFQKNGRKEEDDSARHGCFVFHKR